MKQEKFKVLLYLKKSSLDKSGKAPVMGRVTVGRSMAQFSCKLSCTLSLWNPRESRLDGKSREAVEINTKIEKLLLAVHSAYDSLMERKKPFDAEAVKNLYQGSMNTQMTLLASLDRYIEELKARIGIDVAKTTPATYIATYRSLGKFIQKKFKTKDLAFGQLNELFIREYQDFVLVELGYSMDSVRHYLAILKKICKIAFKEGVSEKFHFAHYKLPKQKLTAPKALSRESFEKIRDLEIPEKRYSHIITRDLFLFACYTGTAYADVVRITQENLFTDEEGNLWLKYARKKTDYRARVKLLPEDWNIKKGIIKTERENNQLVSFRNRLEHTYEHILKEQGVISAELLKNTIIGVNTIPAYLLEAGRVEIERLRVRAIEINSNSTYRESRLMHTNLQSFLCSKGMDDIAFADITGEFGESLKIYLKTGHTRKSSYINRCLTWLNRLIYIAIDQEVIRANPLEDVRYEKKEPAKHRYISKSDLKRIMEIPMRDERLELVRRAFIFSSLTGLAYVDMHRLYPHHIGKTAEGRLYFRKQRVKTNVEAFIPLHPIAEQILMLYNITDDNKPVFPLPVRDKIWYEINQIGILAGLKENLSYHQSRHSFGTLAISAGLSIESIAKMMGHANISTTQGYAKVTDIKISEDMDKLMERRKIKYSESETVNEKGVAR